MHHRTKLYKRSKEMLKVMEEKQIYPIARIVVFKDSTLAEKRPDLSFLDGDKVWVNGRGEAFVNPFLKEVWDYNVDIAIEAAKLRFPGNSIRLCPFSGRI